MARGRREMINANLYHRREVIVRRAKHRLGKIEHRLEVLDGLLKAYLNIDEVIRIIRYEDDPKAVLMKRFRLSEIQVEAILNMRLRALRKLEEIEIRREHDELTAEKEGILKLLESEPREDVEASLEALQRDYERGGGLHLVEVAGGYQITTRPELHEWVRRLFHERKTTKLSVQALETLAVIAYKQPITAPEIAEIRAVNTSGVLATLLERRLIKIAGRKQVVGRPFLYATTREFLIRFGLRDLGDLPKIEDLADVLGFEPREGLTEPPSTGLLPLEGEAIPRGRPGVDPEGGAGPHAEASETPVDAGGSGAGGPVGCGSEP
jgi:segregation and condensation protein B